VQTHRFSSTESSALGHVNHLSTTSLSLGGGVFIGQVKTVHLHSHLYSCRTKVGVSGTGTGNSQLIIGGSGPWSVAEVIPDKIFHHNVNHCRLRSLKMTHQQIGIWDRALTRKEMQAVSSFFMSYFSKDGKIFRPTCLSLSRCDWKSHRFVCRKEISTSPFADTRRAIKGTVLFNTSDLSPAMFCSNGYAPSSDGDAPYISPSGRCYHRVSDSEADCSASYAGRSRICLCSSPCLEGYYGTSSQCRRCPPRSSSAAGNSFVTSCICEDGFYLVTDLAKPYGYVHCVLMKTL
jgi:hypothetical protein